VRFLKSLQATRPRETGFGRRMRGGCRSHPCAEARRCAGEDGLAVHSRRRVGRLMALPVALAWIKPGGEAGEMRPRRDLDRRVALPQWERPTSRKARRAVETTIRRNPSDTPDPKGRGVPPRAGRSLPGPTASRPPADSARPTPTKQHHRETRKPDPASSPSIRTGSRWSAERPDPGRARHQAKAPR
jgi:hypothetical protein